MIVFADASALVSLIANEPDASQFDQAINDAGTVLWSAMSCWETISSLCKSHRFHVTDARLAVQNIADLKPFELVAVAQTELQIALEAYQMYGRRSGHPAKLNMGDCFAYACAKANGARLLYKGNDFARTDLA